mmetsp:Transcript_15453/g.47026  ORF Transcript_15453/g.47026 Transcript_15453/m.47026 type:complete len:96 (-) Transcript_15453:529-816(-)
MARLHLETNLKVLNMSSCAALLTQASCGLCARGVLQLAAVLRQDERALGLMGPSWQVIHSSKSLNMTSCAVLSMQASRGLRAKPFALGMMSDSTA